MGVIAEDLLRPEAFPGRPPPRVELVETHLSWVFLTERAAFKVKKPVDFGFVDFRTVEARRRACDAEVVLNRRLAKDVYVGVVPVRRDAEGRLSFASGDEVVDWAVEMRRLPDAARADLLLARGALTGEQVDAVAERLAEFHWHARCDAETASFGAAEVIEANVAENFAQTRDDIGRYISAAEAAAIEQDHRGFLRDKGALLRARAQAGRVRDGHGDLRLEHLYLEDGGLQVIDCIEFNDRFRFGDVCADVAFLAMDLAEHGRVDLAERLLARYARAADDYDLYSVVDFYESYRAFVRAKISTFLARDEGAPAPLRLRAEAEARRHFLLALSSSRRALVAPVLVAVGGLIAAGKSTVSEAIANEMSAPIVDADRTRKHMLGVAETVHVNDASWKGAYDPAFTTHVYEEVLRRAGAVLASGRSAVIDASFRSRTMRGDARALAKAQGVPFVLVECRADLDVCRQRLVERAKTASVSDGRLEVFDDFCARFEAIDELAAAEHVVLDTTRPLTETLAILRPRVAAWPAGLVT